jgi:predicted HTH transcriptional regulator
VLKHAHEGKPLPDFGNDIVNEALNLIKIENLDKTTLTEAEREMTTKEEMACCLAYAIRKATEEVREEARKEAEKEVNEKVGSAKLEMVDAMIANPKFTDEDIASISGISKEEIQKRRTKS